MADVYDIVIAGGGPAGLTAGLYAARARMEALLIERYGFGGQALIADRIENYPGFPEGVKGPELGEFMLGQAKRFGLKTEQTEVESVALAGGQGARFLIKVAGGKEVKSFSLIIATGARWKELGVPGEKELAGRGVSYCATCDGPLFKGKEVVVVGGGDTALEDALFLTKFASKVTVIHRRGMLRATRILQERARANSRIELCLDSVVVEIAGKGRCQAVKYSDVKTRAVREIRADGVFVLVGMVPNSQCFKGLVDLDESGYIVCDEEMRASQEGVFACGDVRKKAFRQVVTAAGDGATAAFSAQHYVEKLKGVEYK